MASLCCHRCCPCHRYSVVALLQCCHNGNEHCFTCACCVGLLATRAARAHQARGSQGGRGAGGLATGRHPYSPSHPRHSTPTNNVMKAAMARSNADLRRKGADGRVQSYKTQQNATRPRKTGGQRPDETRQDHKRPEKRSRTPGLKHSRILVLQNPRTQESSDPRMLILVSWTPGILECRS